MSAVMTATVVSAFTQKGAAIPKRSTHALDVALSEQWKDVYLEAGLAAHGRLRSRRDSIDRKPAPSATVFLTPLRNAGPDHVLKLRDDPSPCSTRRELWLLATPLN
jgi:hypothetical protein